MKSEMQILRFYVVGQQNNMANFDPSCVTSQTWFHFHHIQHFHTEISKNTIHVGIHIPNGKSPRYYPSYMG